MGSVGTQIRARRTELGLTLQQVAERVGCTKGYLSLVENDRREHPPSAELLALVESALRMEAFSLRRTRDWESTPSEVKREVQGLRQSAAAARRLADLLKEKGVDALHRSGELERLVARLDGREETGRRPVAASKQPAGVSVLGGLPAQVPVINRVAAGYPKEFTDLGYPARVADEYISVPDVYDADAFAARVVGDSMEPEYRAGDIVVFSPGAPTLPGSDCFVRLERDEETTFKRVYFETGADGGERIRLQPLNSAYPPRSLAREEVAGMYAAAYVVRAVGSRPGGNGRPAG